jgi:isochorismate synthase
MMQSEESIIHRTISDTDFLYAAIQRAMEEGESTALWRLPNSTIKNILFSSTPVINTNTDSLEDLEPGFMFAPFDRTTNSYYLKADRIFSIKDGLVTEAPTNNTSETLTQLTLASKDVTRKPISFPKSKNQNVAACEHSAFNLLVKTCVERIEAGEFEKIVPSRCKLVSLPNNFDPIEAFHKLCATYPNAMITLVIIPEVGTWLGATPEVLVQVEDQRYFKTVSLAGTKEYIPGVDLKNVSWTQKEIEEQALVSRYIINCFKKIRLREFDEHGPKTSVAGNIMHLKTEFMVDMQATNFPLLGSVMLNLLHPTSAVCGMPLDSAREFLKQHECYDRSFYSGYLGPVNIQNNIHLFVNLRCMQLLEQAAVCYAGAGVTIDSDVQREWEETETKMKTLLNVIL